jgi:hypothetical protein
MFGKGFVTLCLTLKEDDLKMKIQAIGDASVLVYKLRRRDERYLELFTLKVKAI